MSLFVEDRSLLAFRVRPASYLNLSHVRCLRETFHYRRFIDILTYAHEGTSSSELGNKNPEQK